MSGLPDRSPRATFILSFGEEVRAREAGATLDRRGFEVRVVGPDDEVERWSVHAVREAGPVLSRGFALTELRLGWLARRMGSLGDCERGGRERPQRGWGAASTLCLGTMPDSTSRRRCCSSSRARVFLGVACALARPWRRTASTRRSRRTSVSASGIEIEGFGATSGVRSAHGGDAGAFARCPCPKGSPSAHATAGTMALCMNGQVSRMSNASSRRLRRRHLRRATRLGGVADPPPAHRGQPGGRRGPRAFSAASARPVWSWTLPLRRRMRQERARGGGRRRCRTCRPGATAALCF